MVKKLLFSVIFGLIFFLAGYIGTNIFRSAHNNSGIGIVPVQKPLEIYTYDNISKNGIQSGKFKIGEILEINKDFTSYLFTFEFSPNPQKKELKKTTGMINIPNGSGIYPIIIMFRGYVDQKIYQTGIGTKNASYYFADRGYITISPDFLGYAGSDKEADNIFESRFQTYITAVSLLNSINQIEAWDKNNIFIWGHSNGGQIAITVLEITQKNIPTVLWAPVSKPFPYSILYYTDESEDNGKLIRYELSKFEEVYDVEKYSLSNYINLINKETNIQVHQGSGDDAVPINWTDNFIEKLNSNGINSEYFIYSGADHNLNPLWDLAMERSLNFIDKNKY